MAIGCDNTGTTRATDFLCGLGTWVSLSINKDSLSAIILLFDDSYTGIR